MRDKILQALREAKGNCLTTKALYQIVGSEYPQDLHNNYVYMMLCCCRDMEQEKLLILGRSSGGAYVPRGTITLVSLRLEEKD